MWSGGPEIICRRQSGDGAEVTCHVRLIGKSGGYGQLCQACRRNGLGRPQDRLNAHDLLEMLRSIAACGEEPTVHRAHVPIQAVGDSADGDDGIARENATCSDDGVVVGRGAEQGATHPSFECREPVPKIARLEDSLMEPPSARRDVAQERCAIQELEGGTAEYGMPRSRSQQHLSVRSGYFRVCANGTAWTSAIRSWVFENSCCESSCCSMGCYHAVAVVEMRRSGHPFGALLQ